MEKATKDKSIAVTEGVRVSVRSVYLAQQSSPGFAHYVFAYTVRIKNEGAQGVQLMNRHWVITDGSGGVQEVHGAGVIGERPVLVPGGHFEYTSAAVLRTPRGVMRGSYEMRTQHGRSFDAAVAPFLLAMPLELN